MDISLEERQVKIMMNEIIMELNNRGYKAESTTVVKNGVEKVGVIIGEGTIRPIIYPNLNLTVNECIREIINTYENVPKMNININEVTNWEYVKNNLQLCLQRKTNEDILKRDYLDMEMYIGVKVTKDSTYKVKQGMFKEVSEDEIFARALLNAKENVLVEDMAKMLANMMGCDISELPDMGETKMIVVTNKEKVNGAVAICDKELLSNIAREYNSNLVILPSSIHECIIHVDNEPDMKMYSNMVREVNETQVEPEEVLSDHAYFFNKETCEISW